MKKLTVNQAKAITKPGFYWADTTLYLKVNENRAKSWIQRIVIAGTRRDIGLGGFPVVSLEKARRRAFENRVVVADGRGPLAEKRKAKLPTFRDAPYSHSRH